MRYLLKFSYDGTKFHGFQRQNDVKNVQGTLESVLSDVLEEPILIKGSGRTDACVHAVNQCAHFDTKKNLTRNIINKINVILNKEIVIKKWRKVDDTFHARHSVKKKCYVYKVNNGKYRKDYEGYYYQLRYPLDIKKMKQASKVFVGTHNFQAFVSGERPSYISTIYKIKIVKKKDIVLFKFVGIGFYRYMVRHLVGALLDVARGKVDCLVLRDMLENPLGKKRLSVAPGCGLYLMDIRY